MGCQWGGGLLRVPVGRERPSGGKLGSSTRSRPASHAAPSCVRTIRHRLRGAHQLRGLGQPRPWLPQQRGGAEALRQVGAAGGGSAASSAAAGCPALRCCRCCSRLDNGRILQHALLQGLLSGHGGGAGGGLLHSELREEAVPSEGAGVMCRSGAGLEPLLLICSAQARKAGRHGQRGGSAGTASLGRRPCSSTRAAPMQRPMHAPGSGCRWAAGAMCGARGWAPPLHLSPSRCSSSWTVGARGG